jgi:hypothetical protein
MFKITQNIHLHIGAMESTMMADIKIIWDKVPASYLGNGSSWDEDATPTMMEIMSKQKIRWARNIDVTSVNENHRKGYEEMTINNEPEFSRGHTARAEISNLV